MPHPLLDPAYRPVVGHRGNAMHAPENTLESFRQAIALGADALEFDVRLTRDGVVVVFHDPTVTRTTGADGEVAEHTLAELRALDAGATFTRDAGRSYPYRGRGIGVSTLAEVLEAFPEIPVLIEIKTREASQETRRVIESLGATSRAIVASFDPLAVAPFAGSRIAIGAAPSHVAPLIVPALLGRTFRSLPFATMSLPEWYRGIPVPLGALARAAAPAGTTLHVWTVNDVTKAKALWRRGVHGILSDDPGSMLQARKEMLEARAGQRR